MSQHAGSSIAPDDWRVSVLGKGGHIPAIFKIIPGFLSCSLIFGIVRVLLEATFILDSRELYIFRSPMIQHC